jgi:WD40 repeat protein
VIVWDRTKQTTQTFRLYDNLVYTSILSIAFQPGGHLLAVSSDVYPRTGKGHVYLYDYEKDEKDEPVATYDCGEFACTKVAWSPDGSRLAIASKGGQLQVIDVTNQKTVWVVPLAHRSEINGLAWYPDGHRLITSGIDQRLIQWDTDAKKYLRQIYLPGQSVPTSLALSPDGRFLLAGITNDAGNRFGLWNAETLQKLDFKPSGYSQPVTTVAFSTQGSQFATAGYDNIVLMWNFTPVDSPSTLLMNLPGPRVEGVNADASGQLLFARNMNNGLLDVITQGVEGSPRTLRAPHAVLAFTRLNDQPAIVLEGYDGQVSFMDPASGQSLRDPIKVSNGPVSSLAVSQDGRWLATATCASGVCEPALFDLQSGLEQALKGDFTALKLQNITSLAFNPDSETLAIGTSSGKIVLYDIASGETRQAITEGLSLQNVPVAVTSLVFSPAEQGLLIAGFKDGRVALWDAASLGPVGEFTERLNGEVTGLVVRKRPDSGLWSLVTASSQGEVREWEIDPAAWVARACQMAGRNLTADEKAKFLLPGASQEDVCTTNK